MVYLLPTVLIVACQLSKQAKAALIITNETVDIYTTFKEPTQIDMDTIDELHLFVASRHFNITGEFSNQTAARMKTRLFCWSLDSTLNESNCDIPGPTLIMHGNNKNQTVVLHNLLQGVGGKHAPGDTELYKDPDTTNLHTHGLHVNPLVDDIVDIALDPICPNGTNASQAQDWQCNYNNTEEGDSHAYYYVLNNTHYPGSHWYHAHWHGSVTLQVNGGLYGAIRVKQSEDNIPNLGQYVPNITAANDHTMAISYLWIAPNDLCYTILDNSKKRCGAQGVYNTTNQKYFVHVWGERPFTFAVQSVCWVACMYVEFQEFQWSRSGTQYDVTFVEGGDFDGSDTIETFLINGQSKVCLFSKLIFF